MPVDKFGRMSDTKTKDTGVSLTYINNNYVRSDGGTPLTGSLDMKGNTIYNVADPVNPQDVVTKVYVDNTKGSGVIGRRIGDSVSIKENMDFLGKQKIKKLPDPVNDHDAVTKEYVDNLQTQYIDKRGNIRFDRNINVGNNRIFSLKDPKKDYEATNKKYVDESINKRLQEEKDKFLPQDPATKKYVDEAVKQLAGGDLLVSKEGVFIKDNGHYRATAPLDIDNQKVENLREPLEDGDAVNKKYVDGIVEDLTLKQGLIRENGGFNLVDSYINMNFNNIRNVGNPIHGADAVPRSFVDNVIEDVLNQLKNQIKELNHLVTINASCYKNLKNGDYPFTFGSEYETQKFFSILNGFLVPADGVLKHVSINSTGLVLNVPPNTKLEEFYEGTGPNSKLKLYGKNNPTKLFTLEKMKILSGNETEIIGSVFFIIEEDSKEIKGEKYFYMGFPFFEFRPNIKNLNYDKNFICPVKKGDIINIKSEYTETVITDNTIFDDNINIKAYPYAFFNYPADDEVLTCFLHLATLTFMFKETSFSDISDLVPLKKIITLIEY